MHVRFLIHMRVRAQARTHTRSYASTNSPMWPLPKRSSRQTNARTHLKDSLVMGSPCFLSSFIHAKMVPRKTKTLQMHDHRMDGWTNRPTEGHTLMQSRLIVTKMIEETCKKAKNLVVVVERADGPTDWLTDRRTDNRKVLTWNIRSCSNPLASSMLLSTPEWFSFH